MPMTSASTTSSAHVELLLVVDLDQHVEVELAGLGVQLGELARVERGDDQQDRVGAGHRRLVHLVGVDDEVLAQDRQRAGRARLAQVVQRAAEVRALGEDRQRRGAAALVGARRSRRPSRPRGSRPRRGRAALVLGDDRDARARQRLGERAVLAARRRGARSSSASGTSLAAARDVRRASRRRCAPARSSRLARAPG